MKVETIQLYKDNDLVTLTSYICEDLPDVLNGKQRGAVLICPGGAYLGLSYKEGEPVALKFVSMGYHAFVLHYSVYCEIGKFPTLNEKIVPKEESQHPAPMLDIANAMIYIKERSNQWHLDIDKVAICGFSAGAHNCAMYSVYWNQELIKNCFNVQHEIFRPNATILCYGLTDYVMLMEEQKLKEGLVVELFNQSITAYLGTNQPDHEILVSVSPARLVNSDTPPMFIWATCEDDLVSVEHSTRMATALAQHHIPFEIHVFEKGPHGLSLGNVSVAAGKNLIYQDAAKWSDLAGCWLEKRFSPDIPEVFVWKEAAHLD